MRPYKITWTENSLSSSIKHHLHVDLDHILAIQEPVFIDDDNIGGGYRAEFGIIMAFKDKPILISTRSQATFTPSMNGPPKIKPVEVNGVPEGVLRMNEIFRDLYCAKFGEYPIP